MKLHVQWSEIGSQGSRGRGLPTLRILRLRRRADAGQEQGPYKAINYYQLIMQSSFCLLTDNRCGTRGASTAPIATVLWIQPTWTTLPTMKSTASDVTARNSALTESATEWAPVAWPLIKDLFIYIKKKNYLKEARWIWLSDAWNPLRWRRMLRRRQSAANPQKKKKKKSFSFLLT